MCRQAIADDFAKAKIPDVSGLRFFFAFKRHAVARTDQQRYPDTRLDSHRWSCLQQMPGASNLEAAPGAGRICC